MIELAREIPLNPTATELRTDCCSLPVGDTRSSMRSQSGVMIDAVEFFGGSQIHSIQEESDAIAYSTPPSGDLEWPGLDGHSSERPVSAARS